ncbi:MAG: PTS sugar transporter subunit IIB [Butyricicoccus sp.]|nr:PTS sugar transporter subunit IIB [Butyricicoccus sp.]
MKINSILCCCMSGLGSSFLVEMNVKKVLAQLGMNQVTVNHAGVYDAAPGAADLFICGVDIKEECEKYGPTLALNSLTDYHELEEKFKALIGA